MVLTQQQLDLIDCLKLSGIEREEGVAIMLPLAKSEVAMDKMLDYLIENLQDESFKTGTKADSHHGDVAKLLKDIVTAKENEEKNAVEDENARMSIASAEDAEYAKAVEAGDKAVMRRMVDDVLRQRLCLTQKSWARMVMLTLI